MVNSKVFIGLILIFAFNSCSISYTILIEKRKIFPNQCNKNEVINVELELMRYGEIEHKVIVLSDLEALQDEILLARVDGGLEFGEANFICQINNQKNIFYKSGRVYLLNGLKGRKFYL